MMNRIRSGEWSLATRRLPGGEGPPVRRSWKREKRKAARGVSKKIVVVASFEAATEAWADSWERHYARKGMDWNGGVY